MNKNDSVWQLIANGVMVGLGLVALAIIIFLQFPVGQEFIRELRIATNGLPKGNGPQAPLRTAAPIEPSPDTAAEPLPTSVTLKEIVTIQMGIKKVAFAAGDELLVIGRRPGLYICDYLGDSVEIPMDSVAKP